MSRIILSAHKRLGRGLVPAGVEVVTRTKNRAGGYDTTTETRQLRAFSRPLGSTDRVLLETGDYTLDDRHFYFSNNPHLEIGDIIAFEDKKYEIRKINTRHNSNYTHIVGKAERR